MSSGRNSRFAARKLNVGDLNDNARAKWQAECDAPWPAAVNQLQDLTLLFCVLARPCRGKCVHDFQTCPIGMFLVV